MSKREGLIFLAVVGVVALIINFAVLNNTRATAQPAQPVKPAVVVQKINPDPANPAVVVKAKAAKTQSKSTPGLTWHTANQATVAWEAVEKIEDTDTVKYQLFLRPAVDGAVPVKYGLEIAATQSTLSFAAEGRYYAGVQSVRYPAGETVGLPSETISWSSDPLVCSADGPFGIVYFQPPAPPVGLRRMQ